VRCPSSERLAAATLGADPTALVHAETCEHCSAELAAMVEVGAFARRAPVRTASPERRARIAALVMASADVVAVEPPMRRSRVPVAMFAGAALAAAIALVAWQLRPVQYAVAWPVMAPRVPAPQTAPQIASTVPPPPVEHEVAPVVAHHESPAPAPVAATKATTATSRVFAGSQQHEREGQLTRDQVTLEPGPIVALAHVVSPTAFERGWTALRDGRYTDAIAEFDQVTDPTVGEDAAYWAAIASARAGNKADAIRRLTAFVADYPTSQRVGEARALLVRLTP